MDLNTNARMDWTLHYALLTVRGFINDWNSLLQTGSESYMTVEEKKKKSDMNVEKPLIYKV